MAREDIFELHELMEQEVVKKILVTELTELGRVTKENSGVYEHLGEIAELETIRLSGCIKSGVAEA